MTTMLRKPWSELERYQLWVAYKRNTPLKVMAYWLGRSPTSVSKALLRYNIRPLGSTPRGVKPGRATKDCESYKKLEALMISCKLDKENLKYKLMAHSLVQGITQFELSQQTWAKLAVLGLHGPPPWHQENAKRLRPFRPHTNAQIIAARVDSPVAGCPLEDHSPSTLASTLECRAKLAESINLWVGIENVIAYLTTQGHQVRTYVGSPQLVASGFHYILDGKLARASDLLTAANKIRLENNLNPFMVHSITE